MSITNKHDASNHGNQYQLTCHDTSPGMQLLGVGVIMCHPQVTLTENTQETGGLYPKDDGDKRHCKA